MDVVTYYHDAERLRGTPSVAHCEHWLRFIRTPHAEAAYPCDLVTPDTLATAAEDYQPSPFPVSLTVRNTGTAPASIARFGLYPFRRIEVALPSPEGFVFGPDLLQVTPGLRDIIFEVAIQSNGMPDLIENDNHQGQGNQP